MMGQISIKTKVGWVSAFETNGKIIRIKFKKTQNKHISKNLNAFKTSISNFFTKSSKSIKSKFFIKGSKMQKKIWEELRNIKYGKTKTYGEIARKYKISPRYVGKICSQNKLPLLIPCHRVIRSDGGLGGFSAPGGINLKKKLLELEIN